MISTQVTAASSSGVQGVSQANKSDLSQREYFAAMAMQGLLSRALQGQDPAVVARDAVLFAAYLEVELTKKPVSE